MRRDVESAEQHFHARGRIGADSDDLTVPKHTVVNAGLRLEQPFLVTEAFHANSDRAARRTYVGATPPRGCLLQPQLLWKGRDNSAKPSMNDDIEDFPTYGALTSLPCHPR